MNSRGTWSSSCFLYEFGNVGYIVKMIEKKNKKKIVTIKMFQFNSLCLWKLSLSRCNHPNGIEHQTNIHTFI